MYLMYVMFFECFILVWYKEETGVFRFKQFYGVVMWKEEEKGYCFYIKEKKIKDSRYCTLFYSNFIYASYVSIRL